VDECLCAGIQREQAACEEWKFLRLERRYDEPVRHVDAELVARKPAAGMAVEAGDQALFLGRGLALAVDLSPGHAAIDEFAVLPDRIDASGNRRNAGVGPGRKRKPRGKPISAHSNTSACLESPHERHLEGQQHRPSCAG